MALAYGLPEGPSSGGGAAATEVLLGEAIQALATTPSVRGLVQAGYLAEAQEIIERFVTGYRTRVAL